VYRIDRPPSEAMSLVERALQVAGVDEVYVEGNVVMGTIPLQSAARPAWIVEVDLGVPLEVSGTLVSVAVRFNDETADTEGSSEVDSAPAVGRRVVVELRSLVGDDFYRVPGPEDARQDRDAGWGTLADHAEIDATGMQSLGRDVFEVSAEGRTATVAVVRPERHDVGRSVAVSTPLGVARAGTGFECYVDSQGEFTRYDYGDHDVAMSEGTWQTVRDVEPFGVLTVDDRLGVVEHVLPELVADSETIVRQARTLVAFASEVERAVERQV
jgi:hypothetical protein